MDVCDGCGEPSVESASIYTGIERCIETTRVVGGVCDRIGTCGGAITITGQHAGSGDALVELDAICTACACSSDGLEASGLSSEGIGACIVATITIIACMAVTVGIGDGSDGLVFTSTVCARSTGITKATGAECVLIGICGAATITTSGLAGSGDDLVALVGTCTVCAS